MLPHALLACLLVLSGTEAAVRDKLKASYYVQPEERDSHYLIAPEAFDDIKTFVVAHYRETSNQSLPKLHVKLQLFNDKVGVEPKECSFDLTPRSDAAKTALSALRRLSDEKVVLAWYDELAYDEDRRTRIFVINLNSCERMDLLEDAQGSPIVVPSLGESFDVIVEDERYYCENKGQPSDRCRISYDLEQLDGGGITTFNFDFDWETMKVERLHNGDLLVQGFEDVTYKVIRVDHSTGAMTKLMSLNHPDLEIISTGLSFCWMENPGVDTSVNCVQYTEQDRRILAKKVMFSEPVSLIDVHPTREGEIFLITKRVGCKYELDCWTLAVTKVHEYQSKNVMVPLNFPCVGDQKKLIVFGIKFEKEFSEYELHYACKKEDGYNSRVIYLDNLKL